jgi:UDP-glucose 4-epimerase
MGHYLVTGGCGFIGSNLGGSIAVFDSASKHGVNRGRTVPVVYASSCAVHGNENWLPLREDIQTSPLSGYGVDEFCGEFHARMAASVYGLSSTGLRFFNVYGPVQNPNSAYSGVLTIFCKALSSKQPVTIFGDGLQERDFVYVDDVVDALRCAMDKSDQRSLGGYNVCTGNGISLLDVGKTIAEIYEVDFDPQFLPPREADVRYSIGSPVRCLENLGWSSSTDLETGLRKTIEWLSDQV